MKLALLSIALILIGIPCLFSCARGEDQQIECFSFQGEYDIYLTRVHVMETISIRYNETSYLLASETLYPVPGLSNITVSSGDREIKWQYNNSLLEWTYIPPLSSGENMTYTREWDVQIDTDPEGFGYVVLTIKPTENASIRFRTHDTDIFDSTLPLNSTGYYFGNVSFPGHHIKYSSTYKLYNYHWHGILHNSGSGESKVNLNISIPWDGEFQHVLNVSNGVILEDNLGNRKMHYSFNLAPGYFRDIDTRLTILTETWNPGCSLHLGKTGAYLGLDECYWQVNDPRISAFAEDVTRDLSRDIEKVEALVTSISDHLEYVTVEERRGALWAFLNRKGSCMEHSDLFIACARYLGIPSLYVAGLCGSGDDGDTGHAWVAVWLNDVGWFGLDPTWKYFGSLDSGRLVIRFCNPEDMGVSLTYLGGSISICDRGEDWSFSELTGSEAAALLEVGEDTLLPASCFVMSIFFLGVARIPIDTNRFKFR